MSQTDGRADDEMSSSESVLVKAKGSSDVEGSVEWLENRVSEQDRELKLMKTELEGYQKEKKCLAQRKLSLEEVVKNEHFQKLAAQYQGEIKKLKAELKCTPGNSDTKRISDENQQLKKRNHILHATNTGLIEKLTDLTMRLEAAKKVLPDSVAENDEAIPSSSDARPLSGPSLTERVVEVASEQDGLDHDQMKECLQQYYDMVCSLNKEKQCLLKYIQNLKIAVAVQKKSCSKLSEQLQTVVKERDVLLEQSSKPQIPDESSPRRTESEAQVVELQSKNVALQRKLLNNEDHIKEQEAKIEKLLLRCAEAEGMQNPCASASGSQQEVEAQKEIESLQNLLVKKGEEITELNKMVMIFKDELNKAKVENGVLKDAANPDTVAYTEQLKAFQDDWLEEHKEKQSIIEKSKQLQEDNKNLRLELHQRTQHQHSNHQFSSSGPGLSSFERTPVSPPTRASIRQPFDYSSPHTQQAMPMSRLPGPSPNSGIPAYQQSYPHPTYMRANTIPPRRDGSSHPSMQGYDRSLSLQYGTPYSYSSEQQHLFYHQMPGYNADVPPAMCTFDPGTLSSRPRMPGPQNHSQSHSHQNRPGPR